jgi:hypothetical protein
MLTERIERRLLWLGLRRLSFSSILPACAWVSPPQPLIVLVEPTWHASRPIVRGWSDMPARAVFGVDVAIATTRATSRHNR